MAVLSSIELWNLSPDGFLIVDRRGLVTAVNPALTSMFGAASDGEDLLGLEIEDLLPHEHRSDHVQLREGFFDRPEPREMGSTRELMARDLQGRTFPVAVSLTPLELAGETVVFAAVRDLSDRHRNLRSLEDANRRRKRAEEAERIATELHDNVVQRLFVLGLELDQITGRVVDDHARRRLTGAVDVIDETIREIRHTISELTAPRPPSVSLRDHVTEVVSQLERRSGVVSNLSFRGDVDSVDAASCAAPVREMLDGTIELLSPDPTDGALSIRLDAGASLVIEVNATGTDRPGPPLLEELQRLMAVEHPSAVELDHDDGTTTVQWTVALGD